jgi:hypothetical protein
MPPRWTRYPAVLLVLAALAVPARGSEAAHVHILVVADTAAGGARALGLDLDGKNVVQVLRWALQKQGLEEGPTGRYDITLLEGARATEKDIFDYYRHLRLQPNETLVFYFTGHGGFYPDRGHRLNVRNLLQVGRGRFRAYPAEVDRSDLLAAMGRHHPRALIVLTDCCASTDFPTINREIKVVKENDLPEVPLKGDGDGAVLRQLFFNTKGVVNITAARTGTPARGNRAKGGSFFTVALCKLLKEGAATFTPKKEGMVGWDEFFPLLSKLTEKESWVPVGSGQGGRVGMVHTPEAFRLGLSPKDDRPVGQVEKTTSPLPVVEAILGEKDRKTVKGGKTFFYKEYPVHLEKGRAYLFNLHSPHFDTYLYLQDADGARVAENDDYGGITRSRVLFRPAESGDYTVGVTSFNPQETGRFTLTSYQTKTVGELTAGDPKDRFRTASHFKSYPVHLKAGRSYTVLLESFDTDRLDPELRVEDEYGNTLALNDDEDHSTRLNSIISFRPLFSGTYHIIATTYGPGQTGPFALFVQD